MNWQNIITNLIVQLTPVFEQWFVAWLQSILPTAAASLPAPVPYSGVLVTTVNPVSDANKLLLLYAARGQTNIWNVLKRDRIDRAIAYVKAGNQ